MEQFFQNENTCDLFMNEVKMKTGPLQEPEKREDENVFGN
jgi:hypothetical protein